LGAISQTGVVDISLRKSQASATSKNEGNSCYERSNRNPDIVLFGVTIERNGCIIQKQYE
jgi:hypothetical protein